jgi:hypothetical protein
VSHRYVDADTADAALAAVTEAIVDALELEVSPAHPALAKDYDAASSRKKTQLLAALDGLSSRRWERDVRRSKARLERLIEDQARFHEWAEQHPAPPMKPADREAIARLVTPIEVDHVARKLQQLRRAQGGLVSFD